MRTGVVPFPLDETENRLRFAIQTLSEMGQEMLQLQKDYFGNTSISRKNDPENVQKVCSRIEQQLCDILCYHFPDDGFITPSSNTKQSGNFQWWIDPLDGRRNFVHRIPHFCIVAGISFRGTPVCSVVHIPPTRDTYHAIYGNNTFKNYQPIKTSSISELEYALTASGLPSDYKRKSALKEIMANISVFISSGTGIRRSGSAVIDICWIAEGLFDAFWEVDFKPYDLCATMLILREAGGKLTNFNGQNIELSPTLAGSELLASNGPLHTNLLDLLQQVRKMEGMN